MHPALCMSCPPPARAAVRAECFSNASSLVQDPARCLRVSADLLNCVAECYFLHLPSISPCDDSCCSFAILMEFFSPCPLSHVHFRVVSFSYRITHAASVLFNTEHHSLSCCFFLIMLLFNRLAVPLRSLQKLTKAQRRHHTSLTSICFSPP